MKTLSTYGIPPLAAALAIAMSLLIATAGCKRKEPTEAGGPAASATATEPAPSATTASNMGAEPGAMEAPATATTAEPMGGEATGMGTPAAAATEITSGPITEAQFYAQAMQGDQKEIVTGQMVASQSTNADVKRLANKIASDHEAYDKKVQAAAGSGVSVPTGEVDASVQGKTGMELDRAYADAMVADHQKDITAFENAAKNASTAKARKLASDALPTLRAHLKSAQDLQKKLASG
jgi:putative membrane protein